jgi:hypothetical protein
MKRIPMRSINHLRKKSQLTVLAGVVLAGSFATAFTAAAQDFDDLQTPKSPLVLKAQGSFFVGGELVQREFGDLGAGRDPGQIVIDQMYVRYMVPQARADVSVVMVEGGGLSGKSYETTPDGRMGWDEYFVRKGHATYVVDQVWRGRSGSDVTVFNKVRDGRLPPSALPNMIRTSAERAWVGFRFGPSFGVPYPDTLFPVEKMVEFGKQGVPSFSIPTPGAPDPNFKSLSDLAVKLNGAVLLAHSQSGAFPLQATLINPGAVKGNIVIDGCPGTGAANLTDTELATVVNVPMLGVLGDHRPPGGGPESCQAFIDRFAALGGNAQVIFPPDLGIFGNSHMLMNDKNNLEIADLILKWIDENVGKHKLAKK